MTLSAIQSPESKESLATPASIGPEAAAPIAARTAWRPIVVRGLAVSAVVGVVLNLINQGGAFLLALEHGDPSELHMGYVALNFAVPFAVSVFSSMTTARAAQRAQSKRRLG